MKMRLASARCCCGGGGTLPCDPTTGTNDEFLSLVLSTGQGGWTYSTSISMVPTISPVGTLLLTEPESLLRAPFNFDRCAIWDTNWDLPATLLRADNARWRLRATFEPWSDTTSPVQGLTVFGRFPTGTGNKLYALTQYLEFVVGTGWRHKFTFESPGADPYSVYSGAVIQVAETPTPTGPFTTELELLIDRRRIGASAGTWYANAWWNTTALFSDRDITTPTCSEVEFSHGFGGWQDLRETKVDSWYYFA